jgi:uncharacterized protein (TIGR02118 family)
VTKILSLVKTRPGTSPEAFREYWRGPFLHSILELNQVKKGLVKVAHNHSFPLVIRADFPVSPWAGFSEMWFDSREDGEGFLNHPGLPAVLASHSAVVTEVVQLHCTELPIWDLGTKNPPVKMMTFFHPSRPMTRAQSQDYWTKKHVPIGSALINPKRFCPRYVQNHTLVDYHNAKPEYDFAGTPELWFYSKEDALKLFSETDKLEALRIDEAKFSDRASTVALMTDDQPVYSRTAGFI